jgi:hypothetical protein
MLQWFNSFMNIYYEYWAEWVRALKRVEKNLFNGLVIIGRMKPIENIIFLVMIPIENNISQGIIFNALFSNQNI